MALPVPSSTRELRGLAMAKGFGARNEPSVSIQRLNKLTYKVKSQTDSQKWYTVIKQYGKTFGDNVKEGQWICDCPDHTFRHVVCKHIHAVLFSKLLRKKVYEDIVLTQTPINQNIVNVDPLKVHCPRCFSQNYSKRGQRKNDSGDIQRYKCSDCGKWYIINPAFEKSRASAKVISASIDMYLKGISMRKVSDHVQQFYNVKVSAMAVCKWLRKWVKTVQPYVDSFVPMNVSGVYHVDEMLLHVRNEHNEANMTLEHKENHTNRKFDDHYSWLWNLMDSSTRLWICSTITQKRDTEAGRKVLKEMKQRAPLPKAFVHDGLRTYDEVYEKELFTLENPRIINVRSIGSNESGLQPKVEKLNGFVRDRETVCHGLDNAKATQEWIDAVRIHYNFIKPHSAIGGQTPAEAAGINLNLGENKVESLMRQAAIHNKESVLEPFAKGLGIRMNKIIILNENDCVKVKPKGWLDKKDWREINDILRVQGFNWLANGKDSCWIRMQNSS